MKIYLYNIIIFFNICNIKSNSDVMNNQKELISYQELKTKCKDFFSQKTIDHSINLIKLSYDDLKNTHCQFFNNNFKNQKLNDMLWYSNLLLLTSLLNFKKTALSGVLLIAFIEKKRIIIQ